MYEVYSDDTLVYSPVLAKEGYPVLGAKVTKELNKAGSFEFILPPNNQMYESIQKLKSIITVKQDGDEIFRGRVLHDEKDFYKRKNVYCEGELAFLLDSIQRPYSFQGSPLNLFKQFLNNHNSQVDSWKQFTVGNVTVTDSNDYINRSNSDYSDTWEALNEKLIDTHGGYLTPRVQNGKRYLDYLTEPGKTSSQVIRFGENLLDITEYVTAEDVFTVLIPLGADQQDEEGNSTGKLTIESVNSNKDYIESSVGISLFGRIVKVHEWEDVTEASNLKTKAQNFLDAGISASVSLTLKAVDLHLIDVDTEKFEVGDKIRVISEPHGIDTLFRCTKIELDLMNPDNSVYTFGIAFKALTSKNIEDTKKAYLIASQSVFDASKAMEEAKKAQQQASNAQNAADNAQNTADGAQEAVDDLDTSLDSKGVFSRLTNNGQIQGVLMDEETGDIYINATYIKSGTLNTELLEVLGLVVGENVTMSPDAKISWNQIVDYNDNLIQNASGYTADGTTGWVSDNESHFAVSVADGYTRITRKSTSNTYYVRIPFVKNDIFETSYFGSFSMKVRRSKAKALTIYIMRNNSEICGYYTFNASRFTANTWVELTNSDADSFTIASIGESERLMGNGFTHIAIKSSDFTTNGETIDFEYIQITEKEGLTKEDVTTITKDTVATQHIEASDFTFVDSIKMVDSAKKMNPSALFEIMGTFTDDSGENNDVMANLEMKNLYDLYIRANHIIELLTQALTISTSRTTEISSAEVIISGEKSNGLVDSGVFLKGNVYSQDPVRMDSGSYIHTAKGTSGSTGYVKVARIKITGTYMNVPIIFHVLQRAMKETTISIQFKNENSTDPALDVFTYAGNPSVYLYKADTSTWDLYIKKTESYDYICISEYYNSPYNTGKMSITWTDVHASSLPSGYVAANMYIQQDTGWVTVSSFENSFTQYTGSWATTCGYRKIGNHVYVRGHIAAPSSWSGSTAAEVFTLPSGYRPPSRVCKLNPLTGSRIARIIVTTAGVLSVEWTRNMSDGSVASGELAWIDIGLDFLTD